jgi:hypothetical protein
MPDWNVKLRELTGGLRRLRGVAASHGSAAVSPKGGRGYLSAVSIGPKLEGAPASSIGSGAALDPTRKLGEPFAMKRPCYDIACQEHDRLFVNAVSDFRSFVKLINLFYKAGFE